MIMEERSITETHRGLLKGEFSVKELIGEHLSVIQKKDKDLNAFITVTPELALSQAKKVDEMIAEKKEIPLLAGIPCSVKDAILVEDVKCTAGSALLRDYVAPYNATVVQKLFENYVVIVGKTNMDEFGMGASTENSAFGPVKNPHDTTRVPGGSSGGSAVSVASSEAMISLGEDTGGSIRLPASFCGVVGFKPTYGSVSRNGVIALASSFDQIGPFAKTVEDAELVFHAIRGNDVLDATSFDMPEKRKKAFSIKGLKIGIPKEYFVKGLDKKVEKIVKEGIKKVEDAGAKVQEVTLPHTKYALAAYYIINMSEASANLARYDGIRYGLSTKQKELMDEYLLNRGQGFGEEVKRRIMLGTFALSAGYYEAYYLKAQQVRTLLRQDFEKAFEKVDVIAGPVSPFLPFKIGERFQDPLAMYLVDIYTVSVNLAGLPAISVPAGFADSLPVGLHLIANSFQEQLLFDTAKVFEQATE